MTINMTNPALNVKVDLSYSKISAIEKILFIIVKKWSILKKDFACYVRVAINSTR